MAGDGGLCIMRPRMVKTKSNLRWAARWLVAILVPLVALVALELSLRGARYGEDPSYFHRASLEGREVIVSNPLFTRRFLPTGMDRVPMPVGLDAVKPAGVCRVVVLGSSAALGDPEPAFAIGRHLDVLLSQRFPSTRFEVVNTGLTAVNSHVVREIAADLADVSPDLVVVYTGNNEVVGPWGPGTALTSGELPLLLIRARVLLLATRTGQLVRDLAARLSGGAEARSWQGMKMFLDHQVAADDPRLDRVRDHFRANLEAIVASARAVGAATIICSLPANVRDCAPFASRPALAGAALAEWRRLLAEGDSALTRADTAAALAAWDRAHAHDPLDAALAYRRGKALLATGRRDEARIALAEALERDTLRFRADERVNAVTRELAASLAASSSVPDLAFADIRARLAAADPDGLAGRELLHDHVHLTFRGNAVAARAVLEAAVPLLAARGYRPAEGVISGEDSATAVVLAYTSWDEQSILEKMRERKLEAPFTNQVDHGADLAGLDAALAVLRASPDTVQLPTWIGAYLHALESRPRDPYLLERLAALHVIYGDPLQAVPLLRRLVEVWPGYENAEVNLAVALARIGRLKEAEEQLWIAWRRYPTGAATLEMLSDFLVNHGRDAEAAVALREGLGRGVSPPRFQFRLAQILATSRDRAVRNGPEAVALAEAAAQSMGASNLAVQSTLAAAYAADGQHARAAELQQKIIALVEAQGLSAPREELRQRLALYRSGRSVGEE